jgi:hypothetical protein
LVVDGNGADGSEFEGRSLSTLSPIFGGGVGLRFALAESWLARIEAQALLATRPTQVEIDRASAIVLGSPLVSVVLGVGVAP